MMIWYNMIQLAEFRRIQCRMDVGKKQLSDLRLSQRWYGHGWFDDWILNDKNTTDL